MATATATKTQGRTRVSQFKQGEFFVGHYSNKVFMVTSDGAVEMTTGLHRTMASVSNWTVREPNQGDAIAKTQIASEQKIVKIDMELTEEEAREVFNLVGATPSGDGLQSVYDALDKALSN